MTPIVQATLGKFVAGLTVALVFGSLGTLLASGGVATYVVAAALVCVVVAAVRIGARRAGRTAGPYW